MLEKVRHTGTELSLCLWPCHKGWKRIQRKTFSTLSQIQTSTKKNYPDFSQFQISGAVICEILVHHTFCDKEKTFFFKFHLKRLI